MLNVSSKPYGKEALWIVILLNNKVIPFLCTKLSCLLLLFIHILCILLGTSGVLIYTENKLSIVYIHL